jgi:SOS-response transcriptional repressor LexA
MRPKSRMTDNWDRVLRFIRAYIKLHGVSPSYAVLAKSMGTKSRSNVYRMVRRLEDEGHLQRRPGKFHGVRVVDRSVKDVLSL